MPLDRHISANQITGFAVALLALGLAVYFGILVGNQDFGLAAAILLSFAGALYFAFASAYWIWLAFVWAVFGFLIRPVGPTLSGLHISLALTAIFVAAYAWRRHPSKNANGALNQYFGTFKLSLLIYLCYMAVNAILTMYFPNEPLPVRWANLAKQNVEMWGSFVIVAVALKFPRFCRLPKNFGNWIIAILIIALLINTVIRAYATIILGLGQQAEAGALPVELGTTTVQIPYINLVDSEYTLRAIAPFSALCGAAFLCARSVAGRPVASPLLCALLIASSIIAAAFAGGRATAFLTLMMPSLILFIRKRYSALLVVGAVGLLLLVGIRFTYEANYKLVPFMVQRSVAVIPGMQMEEALTSIDASSNWRYGVALRALDEWRMNARTLLLGRGVYAFTAQDITAIRLDANEGLTEASLLRGATHNAITDHLLITGVLGLILYHCVLFGLLFGVYRLLMARPYFDLVGALCLVVLVETIVLFLVGLLGSGFFVVTAGLLTACIVVLVSQEVDSPIKLGR